MKSISVTSDNIVDGRVVEGAYAQDESITELIVPEGVTDIGEVAFYGCTNLRKLTLPQSLRYIREEAFGETALEELEVPEGMELIAEKAFYSCEKLRKIEVPGRDTVVETDAFGCCDNIKEAYVAAGYPDGLRPHEELQYTLFWCSCPERHSEATGERARRYISENEELVMEWIIKTGNVPAMSGIASNDLLRGSTGSYIERANLKGRREITALLMSMPRHEDDGEFDL